MRPRRIPRAGSPRTPCRPRAGDSRASRHVCRETLGLDLGLDALGAIRGGGMGGEPRGQAALAAGLPQPVEHGEDFDHLARVVVLARHVAQAEIVGLLLVVAAELEEHELHPRLGEIPELGELRADDHPRHEAERRELGLGDLGDGVAGRHVADLVPDHRRELGLGIEMGQDAARHVDEAAGQGERVHRRVVDHAEGPGEARPLAFRGQALPEARHVRLQSVVGVEAERRGDFLVRLLAHRDLLRLAHQHDLLLPGGGIGGAGGDQRERDGGGQTTSVDRVSHDGAPSPSTGHGGPRVKRGRQNDWPCPIGTGRSYDRPGWRKHPSSRSQRASLFVLAATAESAPRLEPRYLELLGRYARGERPQAIAALGEWSLGALQKQVAAVQEARLAAERCPRCPDPLAGVPLRAAVMLHADRDEAEQPEPSGREQPIRCPGPHTLIARRFASILARDPEPGISRAAISSPWRCARSSTRASRTRTRRPGPGSRCSPAMRSSSSPPAACSRRERSWPPRACDPIPPRCKEPG